LSLGRRCLLHVFANTGGSRRAIRPSLVWACGWDRTFSILGGIGTFFVVRRIYLHLTASIERPRPNVRHQRCEERLPLHAIVSRDRSYLFNRRLNIVQVLKDSLFDYALEQKQWDRL